MQIYRRQGCKKMQKVNIKAMQECKDAKKEGRNRKLHKAMQKARMQRKSRRMRRFKKQCKNAKMQNPI